MASKDAYLDHLASVSLFSACSKRELQKIAKASDELTVPAGRVLVEQGDTGRECYILIKGSAAVKRGTRKVATLGAGDCVGELSLLDHGPRTATVVTESDVDLLVLGSRQFAGVLDEVPSLARKLMAALAARVRDLDAKAFG
jgi:CRP/FNR family transcriptional regulator, cyclic AMP receptor protein